MRAELSREGKWIAYEYGHYRYSNTLIWQGAGYPDMPGAYWRRLTEADGIAVSDNGDWYYVYEKHYDG